MQPSVGGELEITSLLQSYLNDRGLSVELMGRAFTWFDTSTHASLLDAGNFVRALEQRWRLHACSPDEIAYGVGWISDSEWLERAQMFGKNAYGDYLRAITKLGPAVNIFTGRSLSPPTKDNLCAGIIQI